ncbi:hypothetical protein M513_10588 [Trichuris suis]|uniref:Peptidase A2 domain-containing protein n=1 Tax=Trichuris suis TaxID=68888 RepID=A0A085LU65_9BILA|nr:hypothetical protein M513_10588 [Trichuris suis]
MELKTLWLSMLDGVCETSRENGFGDGCSVGNARATGTLLVDALAIRETQEAIHRDRADGLEQLKAVQNQPTANATVAPRVFINASVNGMNLCMLVDTGAGRTLISSDVFQRVRGHMALRGSAVRLILADGSPLPVVGEARLRIRLASKNFPIDAVMPYRLHYSALLGIDFLTLHGFVVDLKRNVLSCEGVHPQVPLVLREDDQPSCVEECAYVAEDRNIAPRSTAAVSCSKKRTFSGDAIFESSHHFERQAVMQQGALSPC